jgi:hypothetical protein
MAETDGPPEPSVLCFIIHLALTRPFSGRSHEYYRGRTVPSPVEGERCDLGEEEARKRAFATRPYMATRFRFERRVGVTHVVREVDQVTATRYRGFPSTVDPRLYDEAVSCYADAVAGRTAALYQVGNVKYPGLSDIDLVVVVDRPAWDNNQFFSPYSRLPAQYARFFHHYPRIVPATVADAINVSSCGHAPASGQTGVSENRFGSRRRLIRGTDVLADRTPLGGSDAWPRCRVLETAYLYRRALDEFEARRWIDVTRLVSRAASLRHPMRHLDDLLCRSQDDSYGAALDERRTTLLDGAAPAKAKERAAAEVFDLFRSGFARFDDGVRALFDISAGADIASAAAELLSGRRAAKGIDPAYIAARHRWLRVYHAVLRKYRFSYGSIFALKPYAGRYRTYRQPPLERIAANALYLVRR